MELVFWFDVLEFMCLVSRLVMFWNNIRCFQRNKESHAYSLNVFVANWIIRKLLLILRAPKNRKMIFISTFSGIISWVQDFFLGIKDKLVTFVSAKSNTVLLIFSFQLVITCSRIGSTFSMNRPSHTCALEKMVDAYVL